MVACSRSGGGRCMPASLKLWRRLSPVAGGADQVERLAHHALRGEVWDKALAYCRQAGAKAFTRSAHREAVAYFEQALAALAQLPERRDTLEQAIDLRFDLHNALLPLDEQARLLDHLYAAETLAGGWPILGGSAGSPAICACISPREVSMSVPLRLASVPWRWPVPVVCLMSRPWRTNLGLAYYALGIFGRGSTGAARIVVMPLMRRGATSASVRSSCPLRALAVASLAWWPWPSSETSPRAEPSGTTRYGWPRRVIIPPVWCDASGVLAAGLCRQGDLPQRPPRARTGLALSQDSDHLDSFSPYRSALGVAYAPLRACRRRRAAPEPDARSDHVAGNRMLSMPCALTD